MESFQCILKQSRPGFFAHHFLLSWTCLHSQQKQSNSLVKEWNCDNLLLGSCRIIFRVNCYLNSLGSGTCRDVSLARCYILSFTSMCCHFYFGNLPVCLVFMH